MELTFNKTNEGYVSEFEILNDVNLHIEKDTISTLKLYQKTAGTKYSLVVDTDLTRQTTDDIDIIGSIYPKWIKVVSMVKPTLAIITE